MHHNRSNTCFLLLVLLLLGAPSVRAQEPGLILGTDIPHWEDEPSMWVMLSDSTQVYRVVQGDTVPAHWISDGIEYQMFDSLCRVEYLISELQKNRQRINLLTWISDRNINASAKVLSQTSASDTVRIYTGDTLSFYRQLTWFDNTYSVDTNNYFAVDTLGWAIELVSHTTMERIELLDSLTVLPTPAPARPTIFATRPLFATVRYVVPGAYHGLPVFVRHRVYHRGPGTRHFTRRDAMTTGISRRATDTNVAPWFVLTGHTMPRVAPDMLIDADGRSRMIDLSVVGQYGRRMQFEASGIHENARFAIYDVSGALHSIPLSIRRSSGALLATCDFEAPGVYFIVLLVGDNVLAARKITITQ